VDPTEVHIALAENLFVLFPLKYVSLTYTDFIVSNALNGMTRTRTVF